LIWLLIGYNVSEQLPATILNVIQGIVYGNKIYKLSENVFFLNLLNSVLKPSPFLY
jgi:hypothetical protein